MELFDFCGFQIARNYFNNELCNRYVNNGMELKLYVVTNTKSEGH